jgi:alcohol dehydrogenase (cytochrome c)
LNGCSRAIASHGAGNQEWTSFNGDIANQRYVSFDQINTRTVRRLGAVWVSRPFEAGATSRMTPLVHDGLMFLAAGSHIYALDARNGVVVWVHQTETRQPKGTGIDAMISGLAITRSWGLGLGGGLIFAGMMNGHVIALGEKTGELVWDQLINLEPLAVSKAIVSPPLYVNDVLYLGLGQETTQGHVVAVNAQSGDVLWKVPIVPGPGEPGHETWPQDSEIWRSGGGHPWAAGAADPSLGLVYFVTGNPGPDFGGSVRPGDNLYTDSLIALEAKTGKLRWYHQLIHHDIWDADLSVSPVLFDMTLKGRQRHSVAAMRSDGYLFIFDRVSGEPLAPIEERPVPQNPILFTSPTQPFPRGGESVLPPCESWRRQIPAGFILGCMFDPPSPEVPNQLAQWASVRVAPMSYDPQTGYFYAQGHNSLQWRSIGDDPYLGDTTSLTGDRVPNYPAQSVIVAAIDSRTGRVVWKKELPALDESGYKSNGGALSTGGGLVFHQGGDGTLQAYDARTGRTLWRFQTDFAFSDASPMSYMIEGKQYVAFVAGTRVWSFAQDGKLPMSAPVEPPAREEVKGPIEDTNEIETSALQKVPGNGHRFYFNEYAVSPYRARVQAGSPVTFINNGRKPHTIMARDGSWTTGTLGPTQIATIRFEKAGNYLYFSKEYPWSYGQIIVISPEHGSGTSSKSQQAIPDSDRVSRGRTEYAISCSSCHGENLGGREPAPGLAGPVFNSRWAGHTALELFDRVRTTMPATAPGSLSDDSYRAIVAYILHCNGNDPSIPLDRLTMKRLSATPEAR